jgi:hypothetical protein
MFPVLSLFEKKTEDLRNPLNTVLIPLKVHVCLPFVGEPWNTFQFPSEALSRFGRSFCPSTQFVLKKSIFIFNTTSGLMWHQTSLLEQRQLKPECGNLARCNAEINSA